MIWVGGVILWVSRLVLGLALLRWAWGVTIVSALGATALTWGQALGLGLTVAMLMVPWPQGAKGPIVGMTVQILASLLYAGVLWALLATGVIP